MLDDIYFNQEVKEKDITTNVVPISSKENDKFKK
jgi:hypothetical protein